MGRRFSVWILATTLLMIVALAACGNNGPRTTSFPVPASITVTPSTAVSMDVGTTQTFTAAAHDARNPPRTLTTPLTFVSSNTAVVTVASNGLACAGTWNSLTNPQICTPGPSGVAQITAVAQGVSSPPTTVYVHQHVDNIVVALIPTNPPSSAPCISKDQTKNYQATAFSRGTDITSTVGPFNWTAFNTQVLTVSTTAAGLQAGQAQITGHTPGVTQVFANAGNTTSAPIDVITCPVESISLAIAGTSGNTFTVNSGGSKTITPTVVDSQGVTITGVPLTWSALSPANATVNSTGTVATSQPGASAVVATCTPPTCNIGFTPSTIATIFPGLTAPSLPIYPTNVVTAIINRSSSTAPSGTVYVTTT